MPEFPLPKLEDLILNAVVRQFFEPDIIGFQLGPVPGLPYNNGMPVQGYIPQYGEAPLVRMARALYSENNDKIAKAVWEKIDLAQLTTNVANLCVEKIGIKDQTWGRSETDEMRQIRSMVRERVADELARRALAKIDSDALRAEQEAARAQVEQATDAVTGGPETTG